MSSHFATGATCQSLYWSIYKLRIDRSEIKRFGRIAIHLGHPGNTEQLFGISKTWVCKTVSKCVVEFEKLNIWSNC